MFKVLKKDKNTNARLGVIETKHGVIETPSYVVVGTHGEVRELKASELTKTKTQVIIVNTFHMWRKLKDGGLKDFEGLHKYMGWDSAIMTDSGGFQVFSMGAAREFGVGKVAGKPNYFMALGTEKGSVRVDENGVYFFEDGKEFYLDAEKSIKIQEKLGADIVFAFDEPTSPMHDHGYTEKSLERTHKWGLRSLEAKKSDQLIYGIVQGGSFKDLRIQSAEFISKLDFDGIGIGGAFGSSFGSTKHETLEELRWLNPLLPENKPRHLLGIGLVDDLFAGVSAGIDTFDCVVPTREARHGSLWTLRGRIDIKKSAFKDDNNIIDEICGCFVCSEKQIKRHELRSLFKEKNPEAGRLASSHNVYFFNNLMQEMRQAIKDKGLQELKQKYAL